MADLIKIYTDNPNEREIARAVKVLENDGVIIYPTDGVYAFGCSLHSAKALQRILQIRHKRDDELTIVCSDISMINSFAKISNQQFKVLRRNLPGRFTFIMDASSRVPDKALGRRKKVGVRIPDNTIPLAIVSELNFPMATSSVRNTDDEQEDEYTTDPELINELYGHLVDLVIDGGYGKAIPTTLVDLTTDIPEILRSGGGELQ